MNNKYNFDYFDDIDGLEDISIDDSLYENLFDNIEKNNKKIDYKKEIQDIYKDLLKYKEKDNYELSMISSDEKLLNDYKLIDEIDEVTEEEILSDDSKVIKKNNKFKILIPILLCLVIISFFTITLFKYFNNNKKIMIKFDTDGGSEIANQFVKYNEKLNVPIEPFKLGYIFDGWYLDEELFNFNLPIKDNIILKAHWREDIDDVTNIKFEQEQITLLKGDTKKLVLIMETSNTLIDIIWTSSNENIVTVNNEGYITAKENGTALISAKTKDGTFSTNCIVNVSNNIINVKSMILNKDNFSLNKGESYQLQPLITPLDASDKGLTWSSSNNIVATVVNGKIEALKSGTTIISATTNDGNIKDSLVLTVKEIKKDTSIKNDNDEKINYSVKIQNNNITLEEGMTSNIKVNVIPSNDKLLWTSSDNSIVSVENGLINAKAPGKVIITVKGSSGLYDTCNVIVTEKQVVTNKYRIIFNQLKNNDTDEIKYNISVTKNDSMITDYIVIYNNSNYEPNSLIDNIDINITEAQLNIAGEIVSAQVVYND